MSRKTQAEPFPDERDQAERECQQHAFDYEGCLESHSYRDQLCKLPKNAYFTCVDEHRGLRKPYGPSRHLGDH